MHCLSKSLIQKDVLLNDASGWVRLLSAEGNKAAQERGYSIDSIESFGLHGPEAAAASPPATPGGVTETGSTVTIYVPAEACFFWGIL
jgi:hypothetical protein